MITNKLGIIQKALEINPEVAIVDYKNMALIVNKQNPYQELINYTIAPKEGLYTEKELQDFMLNLVPRLKPEDKKDFFSHELVEPGFGAALDEVLIAAFHVKTPKKPERLSYGNLEFKEIVGEIDRNRLDENYPIGDHLYEKVKDGTALKFLLEIAGYQEGGDNAEKAELWRKIDINVLPNPLIAKLAGYNRSEDSSLGSESIYNGFIIDGKALIVPKLLGHHIDTEDLNKYAKEWEIILNENNPEVLASYGVKI
ncbi:MAG: hypothetical protein KAT28_00300 [Candidatus Aenigmarchaeota archaeon]|nr:hypothetical protein [Candidatus Aenigmarchaeota archaeon]